MDGTNNYLMKFYLELKARNKVLLTTKLDSRKTGLKKKLSTSFHATMPAIGFCSTIDNYNGYG